MHTLLIYVIHYVDSRVASYRHFSVQCICRQIKLRNTLPQSASQRQHLPVEYELSEVTGNSREEDDTMLFNEEENPTMEIPHYVNINKESPKYESVFAAEDGSGE